MSFDISHLPDPQNREPSHWVEFYLVLQNAVAQGERVAVHGRSVDMPSLETINRMLIYWEGRADKAASKASSSGLSPYAPTYVG